MKSNIHKKIGHKAVITWLAGFSNTDTKFTQTITKTCNAYQISEFCIYCIDVTVSIFLDNFTEFTADVVNVVACSMNAHI